MKVYKYRYGSKRDLESLEQDYFYAPHPSKLNDPCENLFDVAGIEQTLAQLASMSSVSTKLLSESFFTLFTQIQENVGIYSLSKTVLDELLWAYYANSHTGFCIEYDLEKLGELTKIAGSFDVLYERCIPQLTFGDLIGVQSDVIKILQLTSGSKSKRWQHENEIRVIMDYFGKVEYDFRAVKAIYFGLRMPKKWQDLHEDNEKLPDHLSQVCQEQVMQALKGRGVKYYQMILKPNSYEFDCIKVEDIYKDAKKYKAEVKFLDKSCIDYSGYGWDIDPSYFDKVAEIICREPYFYEINSIHVSKDQSSYRKEPIIFAGFRKAEKDWTQIKRYFSLAEIDQIYNLLNK